MVGFVPRAGIDGQGDDGNIWAVALVHDPSRAYWRVLDERPSVDVRATWNRHTKTAINPAPVHLGGRGLQGCPEPAPPWSVTDEPPSRTGVLASELTNVPPAPNRTIPMANDADDHRDRGIELGTLPEKIDTVTFPIEKNQLLEECGGHELAFENGDRTTVSSVLGPVGVDEFGSSDELFETIYTMVGRGAVGQAGQTGRGTSDLTPPDEQRPAGRPDDSEDDLSL